jgi:hypothetical protein
MATEQHEQQLRLLGFGKSFSFGFVAQDLKPRTF